MAWPPIVQTAPPADGPDWLYGQTGANIVEPSSGKKAAGWVIDERPGAQFWNWLFQNIAYWIYWLWQGWDLVANPTTTYTVKIGTNAVYGDPTGGTFVVNLLQASAVLGMRVLIKNVAFGSGNSLTVTPFTGDAIEGAAANATDPIAAGEWREYQAGASGKWFVRSQG